MDVPPPPPSAPQPLFLPLLFLLLPEDVAQDPKLEQPVQGAHLPVPDQGKLLCLVIQEAGAGLAQGSLHRELAG